MLRTPTTTFPATTMECTFPFYYIFSLSVSFISGFDNKRFLLLFFVTCIQLYGDQISFLVLIYTLTSKVRETFVSTDLSGMVNVLEEIPVDKWSQLCDLYTERRNHASSYNTLQTFITWITKEPNLPIKIYSLNGEWETDGTFVAEMLNQLFCNTLSEDCTRLVDTLNCFDAHKSHLIAGFQERCLPAVENHFLDAGLKQEQFQPVGTFWYHLPKDKAIKFTIDAPPNIVLKTMDESCAENINRIWPHRSDGSIEFVKGLIRLNKNVGLFEDNELVAWCLILPLGSLGLLQVVDSHKRRGLGSLAVRYISKWLAENDIEVTAPVVFTNFPSRTMFENLGFEVIDKVYWAERPPKL